MYHYTGVIFYYFSRLRFWKTRFRFREENVRSGYTFFVQERPFICRDGPGKGMVGKCIGLKPKLYNCTNSCETVIELYSKLNFFFFLLFNFWSFSRLINVYHCCEYWNRQCIRLRTEFDLQKCYYWTSVLFDFE